MTGFYTTNEKLHFVPGMTLISYLQPDGYYAVHERDNYDIGCVIGYGKTREEAIEEFADRLDERGASGDTMSRYIEFFAPPLIALLLTPFVVKLIFWSVKP